MTSNQTHSSDPIAASPDKALLASALETAVNAIFITDSAGRIIWANHAFSRLSGYSLQEALGHTPALLKSGMQHNSFYRELWQSILAGHAWRGIVIDRNKSGELYTVDQTISPLLDDRGEITHFIAIQQEAMGRTPKQEHEHYLAYHDALTGLPNRARFIEMERQEISQTERTRQPFALLFLDLDKFKEVNDTLGHWAGDQLLLAVAERLSGTVRKSDTVARLGGDEFAILLPELPDAEIVASLADKLNSVIAQPFHIGDATLQISASIGVSVCPGDSNCGEDLIRKADEAMYSVKRRGGNGYQFYRSMH